MKRIEEGKMTLGKKAIPVLAVVVMTVLPGCQNSPKTVLEPYVDFTWLKNTNWLIETEKVQVLLDGWITHIPRTPRPDILKPETLDSDPVVPDTEGVRRVVKAVSADRKLKYILSSHSHPDHSFDTAVWAKLTGAHVIGPRSTCLQAYAQGIPESQCTVIQGGETFDLGGGLSVRVVRWHHSGDVSTPLGLLLQTPMELVDMPAPDPVTGGLRPGILQDFPNGGGSWSYLFTLAHPEHPLTWFYSNTGNADTFKEAAIADEAFFENYNIALENLVVTPQEKSIEEYLIEAMEREELSGVDLWLGYSNSYQVEQIIPILKPKAFIPQHWDGLWTPFFDGLQRSYSNERLVSVLNEAGIDLFSQSQYMDKYRLEANGITPMPNEKVKEELDFLD